MVNTRKLSHTAPLNDTHLNLPDSSVLGKELLWA